MVAAKKGRTAQSLAVCEVPMKARNKKCLTPASWLHRVWSGLVLNPKPSTHGIVIQGSDSLTAWLETQRDAALKDGLHATDRDSGLCKFFGF